MNQFVTVSKNDKNFWLLLTGRFSKSQFAQPVRNLSVNSADETVTFKIINKKSLSLLGALSHWYSLSRNIYLVFPILGGLSYLTATHQAPNLLLFFTSVLSLQFFLLGITLFNDYSDYTSGLDRINDYSSQKPLVMGLVRPYQARQLAFGFVGLSLVFASYCFYIKPMTVLFAVTAVFLSLSLMTGFISRRYKGMSLIATFLMGGPLLILGFEYLCYGRLTLASALLGGVFGYHALKYDFSKQVRDIFYSSKAKIITLPTLFGFERSKLIYSLMSLPHITVLILFAWQAQVSEISLVVLVSLGFEIYINRLFLAAPSFLSSNISDSLSLQKFHYTIESSLLVFIFLRPLWTSSF